MYTVSNRHSKIAGITTSKWNKCNSVSVRVVPPVKDPPLKMYSNTNANSNSTMSTKARPSKVNSDCVSCVDLGYTIFYMMNV